MVVDVDQIDVIIRKEAIFPIIRSLYPFPVHYKVNLRPYSGFILDLGETGAFVETDQEFDTNGKISQKIIY